MKQKEIIAASTVLSLGFLSAMVLIARFLWNHKSAQDNTNTNTTAVAHDALLHDSENRLSHLSIDRAWKRMFALKKDQGRLVPTLSGIIKAGDEAVYSSAWLSTLHGDPGELPLDVLYDAFARELRARPASERSAYSLGMAKFATLSRGTKRSPSVRSARQQVGPRAQRNSLDLSELGLNRARSRRSSPMLVSTFNALPSSEGAIGTPAHASWINELQQAKELDGRTSVVVTPGELAALSVILGAQLSIIERPEEASSVRGRGAFGISISGTTLDNGDYRVALRQHKRRIAQQPAKGSGHSLLVAKHLASGSLPFSQNQKSINAILITNDTLEALKVGTGLHLQQTNLQTPGSRFLCSIPNSRELNFHVLVPSVTSTSVPLLLDAVASLPFIGGLTPLALSTVIQTAQFIASGGLPPARLLQRLDALVEKVQRHAPSWQLFGPLFDDNNAGLLFRERDRLGKLATGVLCDEPLADKVSRMHRYTTLLERLVYLIPDMKPEEALNSVREATKRELERSYQDAVYAHVNGEWDSINAAPGAPQRHSLRSSTRSSMGSTSSPISLSPSFASPRPSSTFPAYNLGRQMEQILKVSLPLNVESVALVARLVIVAWTMSVDTVAWEDHERGFRVPDFKKVKSDMTIW